VVDHQTDRKFSVATSYPFFSVLNMNLKRYHRFLSYIAAVMALALVGCDGAGSGQTDVRSKTASVKPLDEQGCDEPAVQQLAKKMLLLKLRKWQEHKTQSERLMGQATRGSPSDTLINSMRASSIDISGVSLADVAELASPKRPESETPNGIGKGYLFVCQAMAKVKPSKQILQKVSAGAIGTVLQADAESITLPVIFTTESDSHGRLLVGLNMANPLLETMLEVILRPMTPSQKAQVEQ